MANTYIRVNWASIKAKTEKAADKKGRPIARKKAYDLFYRAKAKMIRRFNNDLITLEIEAGPEYSTKNISGTLDGYGNLFSFLGFEHGTDPTKVVRDILETKTTWTPQSPIFRNNQWIFKVFYPTRDEIIKASKNSLPETDISWIDIIENGAPNLQYYLNLKKPNTNSKSWYGFQATEEVNEDLVFKSRDYITDRVLGNFRDTINGSSIQDNE